ncbi:RsmB/NOP family class I SAM-dependent RNA methyltransferase [Accumulibacter sp.]|uniref:RsmB/NOP family class I SAM-dependent RNA methyltransferase n=1 Tax=Accumulibacter sp. TaxID=2053492 RepID=UPI0025F5074D|nr:RsmB/NOP family class I SAM-dependent RNA methyltransferase [Accumulibacter sp.]MCM8596449.1 RsmB/NOP family class I SAM-dependent RNA methyltransferase [Accumulibacter sp.]MCM8627075.1 RsmB/NOP family class I SAM-dependent RNA methyltransferase [Accumulibacter sp.]MDS4050598.1 RsmB/NOP family class I SAM-dependent RNA methyltransferase [Accumulibacter sp.]
MSARLTPALFRHAALLLARLLAAKLPADQVVSTYFREHRQLGHADRGFIAEAVFAVLRRKRSLAARCAGDENPRRLLLAALGCLFGLNRRELDCVLSDAEGQWLARAKALAVSELPAAVRCDLPDWLYDALCAEYPADEVATIAAALNQPAPLDLRVNPLRGSRGQVLETLSAEGINARACSYSPLGIRLAGKPAINRHRLFLDGSVEVQDEGSQLLGFLVQPRRGEMVADFCAGAGGKTLLLGGLMRSQGRVYAFDVAEWRLARLKARLARSGLSNVHPVLIDSERDPRVGRLAGKLDRVLVDAPCSGLGTLRRNPDLKWRQSAASVVELGVRQRSILGAAARLVRAGGRLVYATCSLLDAENGQVVADFLAEHGDFQVVPAQQVLAAQGIEIDCGERLGLWPHRHGTDAFYAAVMERR